jgi:REP element-mobilizing transposase RayT
MDKFKNKYKIKSHRKPNWKYSTNSLYFLTIVTQNRTCNLGEIVNKDGRVYLQLSDYGKIVEDEWFKSFEIRTELFLHQFVLMPNHLHAIVEIKHENRGAMGGGLVDGATVVETHGRVSLRTKPQNIHFIPNNDVTIQSIKPSTIETNSIKRNPPIRLPKSISSFIAGFKSAVNSKIDDYIDENNRKNERDFIHTKYNRNNHFFQPNYHDHVIRNHFEYLAISKYIIHNPENWKRDKLGGCH